jgi:hypothetical protein
MDQRRLISLLHYSKFDQRKKTRNRQEQRRLIALLKGQLERAQGRGGGGGEGREGARRRRRTTKEPSAIV